MQLNFEQIRLYFERRHPGQRIPAREKAPVRCAFHSEDTPSCTLFLDGNGGFNCHACGAKGNLFQFEARFSSCSLDQAEINVAEITGATPLAQRESDSDLGAPVALYDYRDENGLTVFQKRRYQPEIGEKTFRIFRPVEGSWRRGLDSKETGEKTRRILFNLPDLIKANVAFVCEGEKDCESVMNAGLFAGDAYSIAATTSYDGAWQKGHGAKWLDSYAPYFTGKQVMIFEDNDEPGKIYANTIAAAISRYAYRVRIVSFPELPEKGDVSDFLNAHSKEDLEQRVRQSAIWTGTTIKRDNWLVDALKWSLTVDEEIEWLIDGVIQAGGNGMIAAEPKTGKSMVALDLLISLACGVPWLGRKVSRRVRTAYISREDSPLLTKVRIRALLRGKGLDIPEPTDWLWVNTREQLGDFDVDNDEQLASMTEDLKERQVEFAVFDVLNRIHNREENNNGEMAQVMKKIGKIGQDAGCSIGVVQHVSKEQSNARFFTRIRGASAIYGWTEWGIGLSIENLSGRKPIRRAEFETKAGESCDPISFTFEHDPDGLRLSRVGSGPAQYDSAPPVLPERYLRRLNA